MTRIRALRMLHTAKSLHLVASAFYRIGYKLHHKLCLRPQPQLRVTVIIIGSYLAGGAGKTPFTIWLAKLVLEQGEKVAILCHSAAWDEFIMMQQELQDFSNVEVIATKNRYATAKEIQNKFNIIICDDGFEDSRFTGAIRFCLDWQKPPTSWAQLLPSGPFRSLKQDHNEKEIIHLVCGKRNSEAVQVPDIQLSIESITNFSLGSQLNATIICGLGNPNRFIEDLCIFGINVQKTIIRRDHDKHFTQIIEAELSRNNDIIISQKDACRLPQSLLTHPKIHVAIQKITISDRAIAQIALALKA